jgi:hypothetical protein
VSASGVPSGASAPRVHPRIRPRASLIALYGLTLSSQALAFASRPAVARLVGSGRMRPFASDPRPHVGHIQGAHPTALSPLTHPPQATTTERTTQATKTERPQALWSVRSGSLRREATGAISGGVGGGTESPSLRAVSMVTGGCAAAWGMPWGMGRGRPSLGNVARMGR